MIIYETVKAAVTFRQAAEHHGQQVNRNGMTCCPLQGSNSPEQSQRQAHGAAVWRESVEYQIPHGGDYRSFGRVYPRRGKDEDPAQKI